MKSTEKSIVGHIWANCPFMRCRLNAAKCWRWSRPSKGVSGFNFQLPPKRPPVFSVLLPLICYLRLSSIRPHPLIALVIAVRIAVMSGSHTDTFILWAKLKLCSQPRSFSLAPCFTVCWCVCMGCLQVSSDIYWFVCLSVCMLDL